MGDTIAFDRLDELDGPACTATARSQLTAAGEAVLAGRADRVALIGFDRWLGGLHLRAAGPRCGAGTASEASSTDP